MVFSINILSPKTTLRFSCRNHKIICTTQIVFKLTKNVFKIRMKIQFSNTNLIKEKTNLWLLSDSAVDIF